MGKQSFYAGLDKDNKYTVNVFYILFTVNGLYGMMLGPLLPFISMEYALNNTLSGALISINQVGGLLASFIAGVLPIYLGRKRSILFLYCFIMVGFVIVIFTGSPLLLLLGFLFMGISRGSVTIFCNAVVNEVSNSSSRAMSLLHSVYAIGALMSPYLVIVSAGLFGHSGWRAAPVVVLLLNIICMALLSRIKIAETCKEGRQSNRPAYEFPKERNYWVSAGILFFLLCVEATVNGWLVKYFIDAGIMNGEYARTLASLLWGAILAGRIVCLLIGERLSKKLLLLIMSCSALAFYLLILSTTSLVLITLAIAGLGFSMAGIYPTTISAVGETLKSHPMALSTLLIIGSIGAIAMPVITGILSDSFGIFTGMSAVALAAVCMIACTAFMSSLKAQNRSLSSKPAGFLSLFVPKGGTK